MGNIGLKPDYHLSDVSRRKGGAMEGETDKKPRYPSSAILALEPISRKTHVVYVSTLAIDRARKRNIGAKLECAYLVPKVLQAPRHVWKGLRWDDDEMFSDAPGWLSYCKIPSHSYAEDGREKPPRPKRVFMVCVNRDAIVYNWWWVPCDPEDPECPEQYKIRFREQLL